MIHEEPSCIESLNENKTPTDQEITQTEPQAPEKLIIRPKSCTSEKSPVPFTEDKDESLRQIDDEESEYQIIPVSDIKPNRRRSHFSQRNNKKMSSTPLKENISSVAKIENEPSLLQDDNALLDFIEERSRMISENLDSKEESPMIEDTQLNSTTEKFIQPDQHVE